jgi:hypothetical protein
VRALDITIVTEFEHRLGTARRGGDDFVDLGSPAEFLAAVHRGPQRALSGEPTAESGCYPAAGGIQVTGGVYQVDDRFLGEGSGDNAARKAHVGIGLSRDMNDQATGRPDPPAGGDRHVNQRRAAVSKTVQLGGRLVAEQRAFPRVQHGRPQQRFAVHRTRESRVDPPVNLPPSPVPDPGDDRTRGQPRAEGLLPRDHACLETG